MVQPKYSPQEALERVKLMMKYDMGKTLNENRGLVFEQANTEVDIRDLNSEINSFNSDEDVIVDIIKKYKNSADFNKLLTAYKTKYKKDFGLDLARAINSNDSSERKEIEDYLLSLGITANYVSYTGGGSGEQKWVFSSGTGTDVVSTKNKPDKIDSGKGKLLGVGYKPCTGTYTYGCKSEAIKTAQGCLGLVADGKFGPKTQAALKTRGLNTFTDADIIKICEKTKVEEPQYTPGEESVDDVNNG